MPETPCNSQQLIESLVRLFEIKVMRDPLLEPWLASLQRLKAGDVAGSAELVVRAYHGGASIDDYECVVDTVVQVAFERGYQGHWLETLLLQAAESGLTSSAYNVGILIQDRATTPAEYKLANRFYMQAARHSPLPSIRASALVNACNAIRDGLITGKPDWPEAVKVYEQAAEMNLAAAMFNVANVSCWLKDKGHYEYAARAVHWLTTLISKADRGDPFVDIGGEQEVRGIYRMAKDLLAEINAQGQVEVVDHDLILEVAGTQENPDRAAWFRRKAYEHRLRMTAIKAKGAAWENWLSVLAQMGWELAEDPIFLPLGPRCGDSRLLRFKREHGTPLNLVVVDHNETERNEGVYRLYDLAKGVGEKLDGPCLAIGAKGLFVHVGTESYTRSYTVLIGGSESLALVPIWPGATTDEVAAMVGLKGEQYAEHNSDSGNTIPILVNALGTSVEVDGVHFPQAIYVNVGSMFNCPVFSVEQAVELGAQSTRADLAEAIEGITRYWEDVAAKKRRYFAPYP